MNKKGQQEVVGFVLIVVLVVMVSMVFLVISVRNHSGENKNSIEVSNMLDVLMRTTTTCAIVYEPNYDTFEELFKSCFAGSDCSNLNESACDYLNKTLGDVVSSMVRSDASLKSWKGEFFVDNGRGINLWGTGIKNCTGRIEGAQRTIILDSKNLVVRMEVCKI